MPRKRENGLGSFGFKDRSKKDIEKGKVSAAGIYPSERRYGTSVTRSVIEKMDLDSDWVKWRKGYEYYNQAAWYVLEDYDPVKEEYRKAEIPSKLFQGTSAEIDVTFEGYKFATQNSDSNNHYVIKRVIDDQPFYNIGTVNTVHNEFYYDFDRTNKEYLFFKRHKQILIEIDSGPQADGVFEMIGDRLTDGETEATVDFILDSKKEPALYIGKQWKFDPIYELPQNTIIEVEIALWSVDFVDQETEDNWNWDKIVGELIYLPDTFIRRQVTDPNLKTYNFVDDSHYFAVEATYENDLRTPILALDLTSSILPPSLFDLAQVPALFRANATYKITGAWLFKKALYQKYFDNQYLTADVVKDKVERIAFNMLPFKVAGYRLTDNNTIVLKSIPFTSEVKLYADATNGYIAFAAESFTKQVVDDYETKDGGSRYYHRDYLPVYEEGQAKPLQGKEIIRYEKAPIWQRLETDIDPYIDEVFTTGNGLKPAELFTCSCPNFSKSSLRAPDATQGEGTRKNNRQKRYPLPSVEGTMDYEGIGINDAAGAIATWETRADRMKFRMCKHTIAARFIEYVKTKEPNAYQSIDSRISFEKKLAADMAEVAEEFRNSYTRGGITALEILYAMGNVLNLNTVEQANIILNSFGQSAAINEFRSERRFDDDNFRLRL